TACSAPTAIPNRQNCSPGGAGDVANVGSYTGSASPYGTFDQAGNVYEWNESIFGGLSRGIRGGSLNSDPSLAAASAQNLYGATSSNFNIGIRVAAAAVAMDWVVVGDQGNACDTPVCAGSVDYVFRIGKYEVTYAQYVEFL